jgi:hypothetical protein
LSNVAGALALLIVAVGALNIVTEKQRHDAIDAEPGRDAEHVGMSKSMRVWPPTDLSNRPDECRGSRFMSTRAARADLALRSKPLLLRSDASPPAASKVGGRISNTRDLSEALAGT